MRSHLLAFLMLLGSLATAQQPGRLRAAEEVLQLSGMPAAVHAADSAYLAQVLRSSPTWQPYADILREWTDSVYNWEEWKPILIKRLAAELSDTDLADITRFYRTPAGHRWAAIRPQLQGYLAEIAVQTQARLLPKLMAKIRQRAAQIGKPVPLLRSD